MAVTQLTHFRASLTGLSTQDVLEKTAMADKVTCDPGY
jgi:hypothetical protein